MRAVIQRVKSGSVSVEGSIAGAIGRGLVILLGVGEGDGPEDASYLAEKIANLRIFPDAEDKMNLSLLDVEGEALAISQFTLYGDCRKGRRPGFSQAARPDAADALYEKFIACLRELGMAVKTGVFQTHMEVSLVNDGPVTLILDSRKTF